MHIILASSSPRRAELIKKVLKEFPGISLEIIPSNAPESVSPFETPEGYAARTASQKAAEVYSRITNPKLSIVHCPLSIILGFDTVVALNGQIFGKPASMADAERMFRALCGNTHEVITGVAVYGNGKKISGYEKTRVTFGAYDPGIIDPYIKSGAPFDKAGGYGLQDAALKPLITKVEGDPDNVVGLPVALTVRLLKESF